SALHRLDHLVRTALCELLIDHGVADERAVVRDDLGVADRVVREVVAGVVLRCASSGARAHVLGLSSPPRPAPAAGWLSAFIIGAVSDPDRIRASAASPVSVTASGPSAFAREVIASACSSNKRRAVCIPESRTALGAWPVTIATDSARV